MKDQNSKTLKQSKSIQEREADLKKENKAISHIGTNWKARQNLYMALENHDINFAWDESEVKEIVRYCNEGGTVEKLMHQYKRTALDLRVLLFDLALSEELEVLPKDF